MIDSPGEELNASVPEGGGEPTPPPKPWKEQSMSKKHQGRAGDEGPQLVQQPAQENEMIEKHQQERRITGATQKRITSKSTRPKTPPKKEEHKESAPKSSIFKGPIN